MSYEEISLVKGVRISIFWHGFDHKSKFKKIKVQYFCISGMIFLEMIFGVTDYNNY